MFCTGSKFFSRYVCVYFVCTQKWASLLAKSANYLGIALLFYQLVGLLSDDSFSVTCFKTSRLPRGGGRGEGGGSTPLLGHKGMCSPKGYGFWAVFVWKGYRFWAIALRDETKFRVLKWEGVSIFDSGLKQGTENHRFWSETGYRFQGSGRIPPPKSLGSSPGMGDLLSY